MGPLRPVGALWLKELLLAKGPRALGARKRATPWSELPTASSLPPKGPVAVGQSWRVDVSTCVRDLFGWSWLQGLLYRSWLSKMTSCPAPCLLGLMLGAAPKKYLSALVGHRGILGARPLVTQDTEEGVGLPQEIPGNVRLLDQGSYWFHPWQPVPWGSCPATTPHAGGGLSALSAGGLGSTSPSPEVPGQLMGHQPAQGTGLEHPSWGQPPTQDSLLQDLEEPRNGEAGCSRERKSKLQ